MMTTYRACSGLLTSRGWNIVDGEKLEAHVGRLDFVSGFNPPPLLSKAAFIPRGEKVPEILRNAFVETEKSTEINLERIEKVQRVLKVDEPLVLAVWNISIRGCVKEH